MSHLSLSDRIHKLGLPLDKIIVIGSGILDELGIRPAQDIDIAVEPELFETLQSQGWTSTQSPWGEIYYVKGDCEAWAGWRDAGQLKPTYTELLIDTIEIGGIRYMTLDYVKTWKQQKARPKDLADLVLIRAYEEQL